MSYNDFEILKKALKIKLEEAKKDGSIGLLEKKCEKFDRSFSQMFPDHPLTKVLQGNSFEENTNLMFSYIDYLADQKGSSVKSLCESSSFNHALTNRCQEDLKLARKMVRDSALAESLSQQRKTDDKIINNNQNNNDSNLNGNYQNSKPSGDFSKGKGSNKRYKGLVTDFFNKQERLLRNRALHPLTDVNSLVLHTQQFF